MQPAKDRIGADGIRFSAAMTRIWMWVFKIGERRIGNTGDPAPCAGARYCKGESTISECIVSAIQTGESANPRARDELCR